MLLYCIVFYSALPSMIPLLSGMPFVPAQFLAWVLPRFCLILCLIFWVYSIYWAPVYDSYAASMASKRRGLEGYGEGHSIPCEALTKTGQVAVPVKEHLLNPSP